MAPDVLRPSGHRLIQVARRTRIRRPWPSALYPYALDGDHCGKGLDLLNLRAIIVMLAKDRNECPAGMHNSSVGTQVAAEADSGNANDDPRSTKVAKRCGRYGNYWKGGSRDH